MLQTMQFQFETPKGQLFGYNVQGTWHIEDRESGLETAVENVGDWVADWLTKRSVPTCSGFMRMEDNLFIMNGLAVTSVDIHSGAVYKTTLEWVDMMAVIETALSGRDKGVTYYLAYKACVGWPKECRPIP